MHMSTSYSVSSPSVAFANQSEDEWVKIILKNPSVLDRRLKSMRSLLSPQLNVNGDHFVPGSMISGSIVLATGSRPSTKSLSITGIHLSLVGYHRFVGATHPVEPFLHMTIPIHLSSKEAPLVNESRKQIPVMNESFAFHLPLTMDDGITPLPSSFYSKGLGGIQHLLVLSIHYSIKNRPQNPLLMAETIQVHEHAPLAHHFVRAEPQQATRLLTKRSWFKTRTGKITFTGLMHSLPEKSYKMIPISSALSVEPVALSGSPCFIELNIHNDAFAVIDKLDVFLIQHIAVYGKVFDSTQITLHDLACHSSSQLMHSKRTEILKKKYRTSAHAFKNHSTAQNAKWTGVPAGTHRQRLISMDIPPHLYSVRHSSRLVVTYSIDLHLKSQRTWLTSLTLPFTLLSPLSCYAKIPQISLNGHGETIDFLHGHLKIPNLSPQSSTTSLHALHVHSAPQQVSIETHSITSHYAMEEESIHSPMPKAALEECLLDDFDNEWAHSSHIPLPA